MKNFEEYNQAGQSLFDDLKRGLVGVGTHGGSVVFGLEGESVTQKSLTDQDPVVTMGIRKFVSDRIGSLVTRQSDLPVASGRSKAEVRILERKVMLCVRQQKAEALMLAAIDARTDAELCVQAVHAEAMARETAADLVKSYGALLNLASVVHMVPMGAES